MAVFMGFLSRQHSLPIKYQSHLNESNESGVRVKYSSPLARLSPLTARQKPILEFKTKTDPPTAVGFPDSWIADGNEVVDPVVIDILQVK